MKNVINTRTVTVDDEVPQRAEFVSEPVAHKSRCVGGRIKCDISLMSRPTDAVRQSNTSPAELEWILIVIIARTVGTTSGRPRPSENK